MINSIPGYNVTKIDRNRYAVSVNNGNCGAVIMNKNQYKQFAAENGVKVSDHKGLKVLGILAGVAGITAAIVFRKNIADFIKKIDFKGFFEKVKTTSKEGYNKAKEFVVKKGKNATGKVNKK